MEAIPATAIAQWMQLGFAVAVAWFLLTKTLPRAEERADKRDALFTEAMAKRDAAAAAGADKQHAEHAQEIKDLFVHHEKQVDRIITEVRGLDCAPNGRDRSSRG